MQYIKVIDVRRTSIVPVEPDSRLYELEVRRGYAEMERIMRRTIRQRIAGTMMLVTAIASVPILGGNGIALVLLVPMALYLIFRREIGKAERKVKRKWRLKRLSA